ncbi:MAG: hypothetical protein RJQ09_07920 [Cyclobacteriaceae bacterium]
MPVVWSKDVLIGTIGYHNLSNHSIGPILFEKIKNLPWASHVQVEEFNWGPIAIVQWFQALEKTFDRLVIFTAISREMREIGELTIFKWGGETPSPHEIQARIGDAVTGVISPENLLIIGEHFNIWPEEVYLFDIEPGPEKAGPDLTIEVAENVVDYLDILHKVCLHGEQSEENFPTLYGYQMPIS